MGVRFLRQRNRVVSAFLTPIVFWVLIGGGMGRSLQFGGMGGESYIRFFFPGTVVMILLFTAIFSTISIIEDRREGFLQSVLVAPVPRGAIYWGKYLANLAFVGMVEALTLPLFVLFFNVPLGPALPGLLATLVLATAGFVAVGTILSAMAVRTRFAELMLPVLVLPFMVPPLIGAVQVTARLLGGRPLTEVAGWLRLLATYDVVFLTLCTLAFTAVVDE